MEKHKKNQTKDDQQSSSKGSHTCSQKHLNQLTEQLQLDERLDLIDHKILVLSGKGGVGKSTIAANLALSLAQAGKQVGLLDIDIHGPSIPRLFGLEGQVLTGTQDGLKPIEYSENLKVISVGFLLRKLDDAVIWRGPLKYGIIKQFLKDVEWGKLDYLIVDSPPGTGDEPLSIAQLIKNADGALIITTPQDLSINDVRKSIEFCRVLNLPVLGVIENMSGFVCPHCNNRIDIFKSGGGKKMAESMMVPFLGSIPLDPDLVTTSDSGLPYLFRYPGSETAQAIQRALLPIMKLEARVPDKKEEIVTRQNINEDDVRADDGKINIAIPLVENRLSAHFGHCNEFLIAKVDRASGDILKRKLVPAPPHEPGMLPSWLHDQGAQVIIAGGMGQRAQQLFQQKGLTVVVGAESREPDVIIRDYINETLTLGENLCDH
ncbi:iron-sulfur cluster carrier protein MrpORP [candidate division CSSED10-310 bacterium]|uniref:Iron-sulfur cluster carrier protein n=1 Tax=candidate division CSSED10-310 bacterium TaxID=2855610 RepID=A0ABV6Z524_UNCC1